MTERRDPVDEAMDLLRDDDRVELPDPALEQRLRRLHRPQTEGRRPSWWLVAASLLLVASGTFAATGGVERLRTWWYRITIDGAEEFGVVEGDGERQYHYTTEDGTRIQVQVARQLDDQTRRTGIRVVQEGADGVQVDEEEFHEGPRNFERRSRDDVADLEPLHLWLDPELGSLALYLRDVPGQRRTQILVEARESDDELPVVVMAHLGRPLTDVRHANIVENDQGQVVLSLADGVNFEYELLLRPGRALPVPHFESPDGRIRVTVDD